MAKLVLFAFLLIATSCVYKTKNLSDGNRRMYIEYLEYLKVLSQGQISALNYFSKKSNITFFYKDFPSYGVSAFVMFDKILNQQYILFYGYDLQKNLNTILDANSVMQFQLTAKFNSEILRIFRDINLFMVSKIQKDVKKIIIGSELGGSMAYLLALHLTQDLKIPQNEIEVIAFSPFPFAYDLKPKFNSTSVVMEKDEYYNLKLNCCNKVQDEKVHLKNINFASKSKLEDYQNSLKTL